MKPIVQIIARAATEVLGRAGYSLIPNWRLQNRGLALHLRDVFAHFGVDSVIDIGANDGGYARFLRQEVGFNGIIHSFEPVSHLAEKCRQHAETDPMWHIHQIAIGENDGTSDINVMANPVYSSFLYPHDGASETFNHGNVVEHRETVTVRKLSSVMPEIQQESNFLRPYLKIDTQGFDLSVIRGAGSTLDTIPAMQTELSFRPIYQNMPDWTEVLSLLRGRHFDISNMFAVAVDSERRALEFDCVLVNGRAAGAAL